MRFHSCLFAALHLIFSFCFLSLIASRLTLPSPPFPFIHDAIIVFLLILLHLKSLSHLASDFLLFSIFRLCTTHTRFLLPPFLLFYFIYFHFLYIPIEPSFPLSSISLLIHPSIMCFLSSIYFFLSFSYICFIRW